MNIFSSYFETNWRLFSYLKLLAVKTHNFAPADVISIVFAGYADLIKRYHILFQYAQYMDDVSGGKTPMSPSRLSHKMSSSDPMLFFWFCFRVPTFKQIPPVLLGMPLLISGFFCLPLFNL